MKRYTPILLLLAMAVSSFAQVKNSITNSKITFQIKNLGINTGGTLSGVQGNIQIDPANLAASVIDVTADATTINTENDSRDTHLKSVDFFDVAHFPKIAMKSVTIKHKSGNNYTAQFSLTMRDKTKLVDLPFTYVETGGTATLKGSFKLNRLDFGVGGSSLVLSNDVTVTIEVEAAKGQLP